jgi:hypothetical protein
MRTRDDVEKEMLDALADAYRCDEADDEVGAEFARETLCRLGDEWPTIPQTIPQQRPAAEA